MSSHKQYYSNLSESFDLGYTFDQKNTNSINLMQASWVNILIRLVLMYIITIGLWVININMPLVCTSWGVVMILSNHINMISYTFMKKIYIFLNMLNYKHKIIVSNHLILHKQWYL